MIIISDCFNEKTDEGCIKLTSSIAKRLKERGHYIISLNETTSFSDVAVRINKLLLNKKLYREIKGQEGNILYIPFASNTLASAMRILILSLFSRKQVSALFALQWEMRWITKKMLELSKCNIITLSEDSYRYFSSTISNRSIIIHTGVDCSKFVPVDEKRKNEIRKKYSIPLDKTVILHVGHLKHGRNIDAFLSLPEDYIGVLLFSSVTEKEDELRKKIEKRTNLIIFEDYFENIEEAYQMCDLYVFPVSEENNSIDIPLSVLEASACNLRILSTPYKEIKYFENENGLYIKDYTEQFWNYIPSLMKESGINTRNIATKYDWNCSLLIIEEFVDFM